MTTLQIIALTWLHEYFCTDAAPMSSLVSDTHRATGTVSRELLAFDQRLQDMILEARRLGAIDDPDAVADAIDDLMGEDYDWSGVATDYGEGWDHLRDLLAEGFGMLLQISYADEKEYALGVAQKMAWMSRMVAALPFHLADSK